MRGRFSRAPGELYGRAGWLNLQRCDLRKARADLDDFGADFYWRREDF
jgi:hypothetical protein